MRMNKEDNWTLPFETSSNLENCSVEPPHRPHRLLTIWLTAALPFLPSPVGAKLKHSLYPCICWILLPTSSRMKAPGLPVLCVIKVPKPRTMAGRRQSMFWDCTHTDFKRAVVSPLVHPLLRSENPRRWALLRSPRVPRVVPGTWWARRTCFRMRALGTKGVSKFLQFKNIKVSIILPVRGVS